MEVISTTVNEQVHYAGFGRRLVAFILDSFILSIPYSIVGSVFGLGFVGVFQNPDRYSGEAQTTIIASGIILYAVLYVVGLLYYALMESSPRQATIGKLALDIKVMDMQGNRLTFGKALGRNLAKLISGMIFYIGYIMAAFTEKKQGLHDIVANVLVVKN
ncbi:RDD family protein [Roseivirga sp. BDSF3-8]|uniref:RDD family protein n=1 Tax=Roseivirga sp. BDSF3-8 TaxID=3241598 RepID=UPI003532411E